MFIDLHWCSLIFIDFHWISFFSSPSSLLQPKDESDMWQHFLTVSCKSELSCSSYDFRKINHIPIILIFIAVHLFSLIFIDFHWVSFICIDVHWSSLMFIDLHWFSLDFLLFFSLLQPKDESDMWQHFLTVSCKSELSCSSYDFRKINHIPIILIFIAVHLFSLIFIDFHWVSFICIDVHWSSLMFIDLHWFSLDFIIFFSLLPSPAKRWVRYVATFPDSFMQIRAIVLELRLPKD